MKRQRLDLGGQMSVEVDRDWNGVYFIVYSKGVSVLRRCPAEVRKALKLSVGTASRNALDEWLASLEKPEQLSPDPA